MGGQRAGRHLNLGGAPLPDLFQLPDADVLEWRLPLGDDLAQSPSGLFYNHPRAGLCVAVS
jgi:hypothetical protein